jgi:hypothetical protein
MVGPVQGGSLDIAPLGDSGGLDPKASPGGRQGIVGTIVTIDATTRPTETRGVDSTGYKRRQTVATPLRSIKSRRLTAVLRGWYVHLQAARRGRVRRGSLPVTSVRSGVTFAVLVGAVLVGRAPGQSLLNRGFVKTIPAYATGEERNRQTMLRVMEVQIKPMRLIWVDVTDPRTGTKQRQAVWYLVYRCLVRPSTGRLDDTDTRPVNVVDSPPRPSYFMPEFLLTTFSGPNYEVPTATHLDQILPEALEPIRRIEQRPDSLFTRRKIEHGLGVIQPFPDPLPLETPEEELDWIYGVATWTGIDPRTDFFEVTMRGFSNSYELRPDPNGELRPWRRVITQRYILRGDEFDLHNREFEFNGAATWDFQPDETEWRDWKPRPEVLPEPVGEE